jgi:hypothetical protein
VPALGTNLTVEKRLAPHAWLSAATFTPAGAPPVASRLLLSVAADAPELVNPAAASWVQDGGRFAPFRMPAEFSSGGLRPGYWQELAPAQVPDPANPPQPWTRMVAKVRLPLSGDFWAAEWSLLADPLYDGDAIFAYDVHAGPGRWGRLAFTALADEAKALALVESTPTWKATPVQVQDKNGLPPAGAALQQVALTAWPLHAPEGWRLPLPGSWQAPAEGGPDAQGLWHPLLPIGTPIHLENQPWSCGPGTWWFGALDVTPADPPPAVTPLLKLTEEKPLPPCIPAPPFPVAGARTKKAGAAQSSRRGARR